MSQKPNGYNLCFCVRMAEQKPEMGFSGGWQMATTPLKLREILVPLTPAY